MSKPKLLLLVTGQVRTIAKPESTRLAFSNYEVESYCSTWFELGRKQFGASNPSIIQQVFGPFLPLLLPNNYWGENGIAEFFKKYNFPKGSPVDLAALDASFCCVDYDVQSESSVDFSCFDQKFPGSLRLFYKIQRLARTFSDQKINSFDFVARIRPDIDFKHPIDVLENHFICDGFHRNFVGDNLMLLPASNFGFFKDVFDRYLDSGCPYVHKFLFDEFGKTNLKIKEVSHSNIIRVSQTTDFYSHLFSGSCSDDLHAMRDLAIQLYKLPNINSFRKSAYFDKLFEYSDRSLGAAFLLSHLIGDRFLLERSLVRMPLGKDERLSKAFESINWNSTFDRWKNNRNISKWFLF